MRILGDVVHLLYLSRSVHSIDRASVIRTIMGSNVVTVMMQTILGRFGVVHELDACCVGRALRLVDLRVILHIQVP